ncbi:MAG TPA: class I adenylate-forming enzyme family protein [Solirubrobacterales bacterium]|nr:class I adenylate-forming enzyme family protein [Solirubrobacterales bacterium]HVY96757.1 class I adenylate-forming enzyme family protein [Solirubrobacterales bacterium]
MSGTARAGDPGAAVAELTWAAALDAAVAHVGPDKVAFFFEGPEWRSRLTYGDWLRLSDRAAAALTRLGVEPGDRVAVASPGGPVWPVMQTACSRAGAILLPLSIRYRRDELMYVLGRARPKVVIALERLRQTTIVENIRGALDALAEEGAGGPGAPTGPASPRPPLVWFADATAPGEDSAAPTPDPGATEMSWEGFAGLGVELPEIWPDVDARDPVLLQFTSGTTAFPKGALLSSRASNGVAFHLAERMGLREDDVMFSTQPFYHVGGTIGTTLMPLTHRCTMAVPERYRPEVAREVVRRYGATVRTGQAAMYAAELADPGFDADDYKTLSRGWGAGAPALVDAITGRMGVTDLIMAYGLTEAASISTACSWTDPPEVRTRCCGKPLPGMEVLIAGPEGVTDEPGVVGEIRIRGWSLMEGYFEDPAATAAAIDADGWLHTGDVGRLDADGNLHFVDRLKDMIKPGGENVSAAEVERVISELPAVARVAVVGGPDPRLGEVPVAFVELSSGAALDEEELIEFCRREMADFKVPRRVLFVDDWPMTESGKVQKNELKARLGGTGDQLVGSSG